MSKNSEIKNNDHGNNQNNTSPRVKVLYQNLNGTWYAFAENGGELYFGKVPVKMSAKDAKATSVAKSDQPADKTA